MSQDDIETYLSRLRAPSPEAGLQARILSAAPAVGASNDRFRRAAQIAAVFVICVGALSLFGLSNGGSDAAFYQQAAIDSGFGEIYDWTNGR